VASSMKKTATRLARRTPARKCLPSASTIIMRCGYAKRRLSASCLAGTRRKGSPMRPHARQIVLRSTASNGPITPRSRARRTSSGTEA